MVDGISSFAARLDGLFAQPDSGARWTNVALVAALSQIGVAVTAAYLSELRKGKRDNPSARLVWGFSQVFGVPMEFFFTDLDGDAGVHAMHNPRAHAIALGATTLSERSLAALESTLDTLRMVDDRNAMSNNSESTRSSTGQEN